MRTLSRRLGHALTLAALGAVVILPFGSASAEGGATLVEQVNPDYPMNALSRNLEGWVELEFTVDPEGKVKNVSVVASEPARVFDLAAVRAVSRWKFEPAQRDGQAVASQERRRLVFKL